MLIWRCDVCRHEEPAIEPYALGDSEPCVFCEDGDQGLATVVEDGAEKRA